MSRPSRIAIVKELGSRKPRCLAAHAAHGKEQPELVVVERYPAALGADVLAVIEEDTKELSTLEHTNLASLIATVRLKGDVAVLSDWVDGESLAALLAAPQKPPFEVLAWALVDVLEGLAALHARGRVCGALTPADVFVCVDGKTRVTRFALGRVAPNLLAEERLPYMAPEFLRGERSPRGDVFTVGALARACLKDVSPLTPVIEKAASAEPGARYATAREMVTAITSALGAKMGTRAVVSQYIARNFGEAIQARVAKLEPKFDVSLSMSSPMTTEPPPAVVVPGPAKMPEPASVAEAPPAPKMEEPTPAVVVPGPAKMPAVALHEAPAAAKSPAPKPVAEKPAPTPKPVPADKPSEPKAVPAAAAHAAPAPKAVGLKVGPAPKRAPSQPDTAPRVTVAARKAEPSTPEAKSKKAAEPAPPPAKTNGHAAPATAATPPPEVQAVEVKTPSIPVTMEEPEEEGAPKSAREDTAEFELVSVRPPPAPKAKPAPAPAPVAPAKQDVAPKKPEPEEAPKAGSRRDVTTVRPPAPRPAPEDTGAEESVAPPTASRSWLLFFVGIILFGVGFLLGRFTSPEVPAGVAPPPLTIPTSTVSAAGPASAVSTNELPAPSASAATSASTPSAPSAAPSTESSAGARPRPFAVPSASASTGKPYQPLGI